MTDPDPTATDGTVLADLEMTRSVAVQLSVVGTLGFLVAFGVFSGLYQAATGGTVDLGFAPAGVGWWNGALDLLVVAVLATVVLVPHEWVHGLAIRRYGGTPRYGVGVAHVVLPYAYATTDHRFTRDQFVAVALAPLVALSVVGTALMLAFGWSWLVVPLAANAGGAVGDLWMALAVLGYPEHVSVEDHENGVRVLGHPRDRAGSPSVSRLAWDALAGGAVGVVGVLVVLGVVAPLLLPALGVSSLTVGRPGTVTYLFAFSATADELSLGVGPAAFLLGGLAGLAFAFLRPWWTGRHGAT